MGTRKVVLVSPEMEGTTSIIISLPGSIIPITLFQFGHVFSNMDYRTAILSIRVSEFQLGHVSSDMDCRQHPVRWKLIKEVKMYE